MSHKRLTTACGVCATENPNAQMIPVDSVRPELTELITVEHPDWRKTGYICREDLLKYRQQHVNGLLSSERTELTELDQAVIHSIAEQGTLTKDVETAFGERLSVGDRWADRIASFGGSWSFIGWFGVILLGWMAINLFPVGSPAFDPIPIHFAQSGAVLHCCDTGASDYDEPAPTRGQGSSTVPK